MGAFKINKERFFKQSKLKSFTYSTFKADDKLTVIEVVTPEVKEGANLKDFFVVSNQDGERFSLPIAEYTKMSTASGKSLYSSEEDGEGLLLPKTIQITDSKDRTFTDGSVTVYPFFAYKRAQECLDDRDEEDGLTWFDMVKEGDLKEDNTLKPLQNYTVAVEF